MTERDYDDLLDIVQDAVGARTCDVAFASQTDPVPVAANDNQLAWPLTPFPAGWHASP